MLECLLCCNEHGAFPSDTVMQRWVQNLQFWLLMPIMTKLVHFLHYTCESSDACHKGHVTNPMNDAVVHLLQIA